MFPQFIQSAMVIIGLELVKSFFKICDRIHDNYLIAVLGGFYRIFIFNKIIPSFFQFKGEFLGTGFNNPAII